MKKYFMGIFILFLFGAYTDLYAVTFNDGFIHIIDSGNSYPFEEIIVSDGPGSTTTTVIVETGGQASGLDASENSVITLDGGYLTAPFYVRDNVELSVLDGSVTQINALANSKVWVSGGTTSALNCENCSYLNISGGLFTWGLNIHNLDYGEVSGGSMATIDTWSSEIHFFGGEVTDQLAVFETSIINVFAGDFPNDFHINDNSMANVYGGNFPYGIFTHHNAQLNIYGGFFDDTIKAFDTSEITISGYGFNYPYGNITAISGTLTGFLDDGTYLNIDFERASTAIITLVLSEVDIDAIIDFFYSAVDEGTIYGRGRKPWLKNVRLWLFGQMLESVKWHLDHDRTKAACRRLDSIDRRCDGDRRPPDFIDGNADAMGTLIGMLDDLSASLGCE